MDEQAAKKSRELFGSGFYCAESVLMAIAESRNIQSDLTAPHRDRVLQWNGTHRRAMRSSERSDHGS